MYSDRDASCDARPKTPTQSSQITGRPTTPRKSPGSPSSLYSKSPRSPRNTIWSQEQQRRTFLNHLMKWSANHDASPYFNGKINLLTQAESVESIELGKSIKCVLTDTAWTDASKHIVVRLFPPGARDARYKLVVRCGAGWMSARDFLSKEYFTFQHAEQVKKNDPSDAKNLDGSLRSRSSLLGPKPGDKDSVAIQPLFLPFLKLPLELQQMILGTAAGITGQYRLNRNPPHSPSHRQAVHHHVPTVPLSPISLATMMKISKSLNEHLVPWVYRTTDFHFGTTGFTNFLWLSGPHGRSELKRITFRFSDLGLLHCLRWLAPDPIFELFDPPVKTDPPALCYLWRCQVMDLAKEVHLALLTIDICGVPLPDLPMMVRILRHAFGSVEHIRFKHGPLVADMSHVRMNGLRAKRSWREECRGWFERRKGDRNRHTWPGMSDEKKKMEVEDLERDMERNKSFFDRVECAWVR